MSHPTIALESVSISFRGEPLLKNINFQIWPQEAFVMVGPSGHGKSVIMKMIAGIIQPTSGTVFVDGVNLNSVSARERTQTLLKMGMLFQKNALFDSMSVEENVAFPLREVGKLSQSEIDEKVTFFLDAVGIIHARALFPDEISGGMQKRLGIARALALDPQIVLYDDPTAGLDPITSRKIIDLIKTLQRKNKSTVLAITNEMARAYQFADRLGMVVDENLIVMGDVSQTKAHLDPRVVQFINGQVEGPLTDHA